MRQNKVLGLAIATALSMSVSSSYAGDLKIYYGDSGCTLQEDNPTYASEYMFDPADAVPDGDDCTADDSGKDDLDSSGENGDAASTPNIDDSDTSNDHAGLAVNDRYIYAVYTVEETLSSNFKATFALNNGATFGDDIVLGSGDTLDFVAHPSGTHSAVIPSSGGNAGDSEVTFLVQPTDNNGFNRIGDNTLVLRFQLTDLDALQSPGEEIKMTVSLFDSSGNTQIDTPSETEVVATSARGSDIELSADSGPAEIDVSTGSINFIGNGIITSTMVSLGSIKLASETDGPIVADGSSWEFGTDDPTPDSATLTVTNGNFAASLSTADGGTGNGAVFIELDGADDESYDTDDSDPNEPADIAATSVTDDTATWELDADDVANMVEATTSYITILADGTTEINDFNDPPEATFVITYSGGKKDTFKKKLLQIERNGTVCTLYNVPNITALDVMNLRITNTSSKEGVLRGTLRLMDGTILFNNELLLGTEDAPETIAPNETIRLTSQNIDDVSVAAGNASGWSGRAILTVSSDVTSMEMYGLLRNANGGPLINMSVGGSGSGCD
jgi:hypothetical protein